MRRTSSACAVALLACGLLSAGCFEPVDEATPDPGQRGGRKDGGPGGGGGGGGDGGVDSGFDPGDAGQDDGGVVTQDGGPFLDGGDADAGALDGGSIQPDAGRDGGRLPDGGVLLTDAGIVNQLSAPLHESAAFHDGTKLWVLGGSSTNNVRQSSIFSIDPRSGVVFAPSATLPSATAGAYVASKGHVAYLFGGDSGNGLLRTIVKFDSSTLAVKTMNAQLPSARYLGAAAWVGSYIYLFGGWDGSTTLQQIHRYDTATDTLVELSSAVSLRREQAAAFALGGFIYIVAGNIGAGATNATVVRFNPGTGQLTTLPFQNPWPRAYSGSASDGTYGYLFGGLRSDWSPTEEIVRFDPAAERFEVVGRLSIAKHGNPWVWTGTGFWTIGGMNVPQWRWLSALQHWAPAPP